MKTADKSRISIRFRVLACIGLIGFGLIAVSNGQNGEEKDYKIRIGVEEVRLDAVVLDRKGNQVTNLTVDDFEIRQDGVPQKLTSATYVNEYQVQPKSQPGAARDSKLQPPAPALMLTSKDVRRTFVFVVENIEMDFSQIYDARRALRTFVETQMQPGDLVAIVPTAGGDTEFQTFTSDKQHLLSIIGNLQWIDHRGIYDPIIQLTAISYCIKSLQVMPGRKSLILISMDIWLPGQDLWERSEDGALTFKNKYDDEQMREIYKLLAATALHAGVVVHTLDITELAGPEQIFVDYGAEKRWPVSGPNIHLEGLVPSDNRGRIIDKAAERSRNLNKRGPIPLSEKTGGLFIKDSNFSSSPSGIGRASEMIKGYYLLAYVPPADTFSKDVKNNYVNIRIKVKRSGCEVHTRDGFFRTPATSNTSSEKTGSLQEAIFSPFRNNDLEVNLASGFIDDPQKGYLLQSWVHVDARDLSIGEAKGGIHSISLEGACLTSNIDNNILDSSTQRYDYSFKSADVPWIKEHGLQFSIALPVKKPGAYYVRAAMKELGSGKIGSAYQFIEIPDLKKGRLSLSNIFVVNRDEDMPGGRTNTSELSPDVRRDSRKSSALRSYASGEAIDFTAVIYNAEAGLNQKPDLESQFTLFGNGNELFKSEIIAVDLRSATDFQRIPIRKTLTLAQSVEPGDYVLQLQVTDKQSNKKNSVATQTLYFKVSAK
jgi:VWFA-related protein